MIQEKYQHIAHSYIAAMTLLNLSGQGEIWLTKGETFAKENINNFKGNTAELSLI